MISFVASAYNRPNDLRVMLASLIAQTSPAWECIVMDEGDNWHVIEQMADSRIKWRSIERQIITLDGRGSLGYMAKHAGVGHASGSHIAFASDDLYYLPQFVERMSGHSEDIVGCNMYINYAGGVNCLRFAPKVTFADCANYVIRQAAYMKHPFTEFVDRIGTADGLCVERCVADGSSWKHVNRYLVMHGEERP